MNGTKERAQLAAGFRATAEEGARIERERIAQLRANVDRETIEQRPRFGIGDCVVWRPTGWVAAQLSWRDYPARVVQITVSWVVIEYIDDARRVRQASVNPADLHAIGGAHE